jgi:hypothetical protein
MTITSVQTILKSSLPKGDQGYSGSFGYTGSAAGFVGSKGESSFVYSITPPINPQVGDRWFDSADGGEYVWTIDEDSGQWVEVAASGFQGPIGYVGSSGAFAAIGYTGSGGQGYTGSNAPQGYTGSRGISGASVYRGYVGSQGDMGPTGDQGEPGFIGSFGYTGSQGFTGYSGSRGYMGSGAVSTSVGPTLPVHVAEGYQWLDTETGDIYVYYNGQWVSTGGASGALAIVSASAPLVPVTGQVWYDTASYMLKIYNNNTWTSVLSTIGGNLAVTGSITQNGQTTPTSADLLTYNFAF